MPTIKDYLRKQQPTLEEREDIKARAYSFTTQAALARVFKCYPQQITQAFNGLQPTLMNKIKNYVENHLDRKEQKQVA